MRCAFANLLNVGSETGVFSLFTVSDFICKVEKKRHWEAVNCKKKNRFLKTDINR